MTTSQNELLTNGDFSDGTLGQVTTFTGTGFGGNSAAPGWTVFNNTAATTTQLVASTLSDHSQMLQVTTGSPRCGIVQRLPQPYPGPGHLEVMVFVLSGRVGCGLGLGGEQSSTTLRGDRSDPGEINRPNTRCSSGGARNGSPRRSWHRADRRTAGPSGRSGG
jgi:hypothetical protein